MIRFIHTADWQIGMKLRGLGVASQVLRDARLMQQLLTGKVRPRI